MISVVMLMEAFPIVLPTINIPPAEGTLILLSNIKLEPSYESVPLSESGLQAASLASKEIAVVPVKP